MLLYHKNTHMSMLRHVFFCAAFATLPYRSAAEIIFR